LKIALEIGEVELKVVEHTFTTVSFQPPDFQARREKHSKLVWALVTSNPLLLVNVLRALPERILVYKCARNRVFLDDEEQGRQAIEALRRAEIR
jgi:hypothetical protein